MKNHKWCLFTLFLLWGSSFNAAALVIVEHDFETTSIVDFQINGIAEISASNGNGYLELRDNEFDFNNPVDSSLQLTSNGGPGSYSFSFDFNASIGPVQTAFDFPDLFQASIYFTDDISTFNIFDASSFEVIDLFSYDALGFSQLNQNVVTAAGGLGDTVEIQFITEYQYIIPQFTLFEFDYIAENSSVRLDNVILDKTVVEVPEPSSILLLLSGLFCLSSVNRRRKS